jgi:hypothetical protein
MKRLLVALLPLAWACAAETAPAPPPPDPGPPDPDSPRICYEMADKVAGAAEQRCRQDKKTNYDAFVAQAKCDQVTNIRNVVDLRKDCFDFLPTLSCANLVAGRIPVACAAQLIRPR